MNTIASLKVLESSYYQYYPLLIEKASVGGGARKQRLLIAVDLVEKTEAHVVVGFLFGFFLGGGLGLFFRRFGGGGSSGDGRSGGGQSGELLRIGQHILDLLSLLEGVIRLNGDGQQIPEGVGDHVRHGGGSGIADAETSHGDDGGAFDELLANILIGDVQHGRVEDRTAIVHLQDLQSVSEGVNVEHTEERGLGSSHLLVLLDDVNFVENFNRSSGNLRGDLQSLEEGGLLWTKAGVHGRNEDVDGRHGTCFGGSRLLVAKQLVADLHQIGFREHETDVVADVREDLLESGIGVEMSSDGLPHHGILSHQHFGSPTKGDTNLLHLVGTDIVGADDEEFGELIQKFEELEEIVGLPGRFVFPAHLEWLKLRLPRVKQGWPKTGLKTKGEF